MTQNLAIEKIERYLFSPQSLAKFVGVLDKSAIPYIRSVMIAVEADVELQKCSPESIGVSALRAASLQLSCDPATKQAYLVAYWNNKKNCHEAQFLPHYLGLYALAVRTNKYSVINVTPFPAEYRMELDLSTGDYVILNGDDKPAVYAPKVKPEDAGAWYGYLRTTRGFTKKVWMTKQEIHDHARRFSHNYSSDKSLWKNKNQVATMEMKTVLRELLNWADKSGYGDNSLREALRSDEPIDAEATDVETVEEPMVEGEAVAAEEQPVPTVEVPGPKYNYSNSNIIEAVMKVTSWSKQETAAAMSEAYKSQRIPKELTILEAETFARTFVPA
jgi:recombination protein RecT